MTFLSVLEMVWINWAGPMSRLVSKELIGELMEVHGIRSSLAEWTC